MNKDFKLKEGDVVILRPDTVKNKCFTGCMMTVTEPKSFGAQGYVQGLGKGGDEIGGQAYYRASWDEMEYVGSTEWVVK